MRVEDITKRSAVTIVGTMNELAIREPAHVRIRFIQERDGQQRIEDAAPSGKERGRAYERRAMREQQAIDERLECFPVTIS